MDKQRTDKYLLNASCPALSDQKRADNKGPLLREIAGEPFFVSMHEKVGQWQKSTRLQSGIKKHIVAMNTLRIQHMAEDNLNLRGIAPHDAA